MAAPGPTLSTTATDTAPAPAGESALVRWSLIAVAVGFLTLFVVIPAANVFTQALSRGWHAYATTFFPDTPKADESSLPRKERRVLQRERDEAADTWGAIRMTLGVAAVAVPLNTVFGVAASWLIARFRFKGRSVLLALIDLPFSVSPVVAGLIFVLLFGRQGWFGNWATHFHWTLHAPYWRGFAGHFWPVGLRATDYVGVVFTPLAMILATMFITFPFVARNLIPLMEAQGSDDELAAMTLGAGHWQMFRRVTLPNIKWGLLYGVILCNARAMGEFGAVSVVGANIRSEHTIPLRVEDVWQSGNTQAAFSVASLLAVLALITLILKSILEFKTRGEARDAAEA